MTNNLLPIINTCLLAIIAMGLAVTTCISLAYLADDLMGMGLLTAFAVGACMAVAAEEALKRKGLI